MATKAGFHPAPLIPYAEKTNLKFKINLHKSGLIQDSLEKAKSFTEDAFGMAFELLLLSSLIFELLFVNTFGILKTAPFLALSFLNIVLWLMHLTHQKGMKV